MLLVSPASKTLLSSFLISLKHADISFVTSKFHGPVNPCKCRGPSAPHYWYYVLDTDICLVIAGHCFASVPKKAQHFLLAANV